MASTLDEAEFTDRVQREQADHNRRLNKMSKHEPLPPIPAYAPKRGTRWKHRESRDQYGIVCVGYKEADLTIWVSYTRNQVVWHRPIANFLERYTPDDPPIYGSSNNDHEDDGA